MKALGADLAPASVKLTMAWVGAILKAAVGDGLIARPPATEVRTPPVLQAKAHPLPISTVQAIARTIEPRYAAIVLLGAGTGVRISEALGLTTDRVDFLRRRVTIDRQLTRDRGPMPEFGPVKDRLGRSRTIPLAQPTIDALASHIQTYGAGPEGLVFTNSKGHPVGKTEFATAWRKAADPLGVRSGQGCHQLRHVYASLLIAAGESIKTVQDRLGHTSAQMTLDVYGHLWPEDEDKTRDAITKALGDYAAG